MRSRATTSITGRTPTETRLTAATAAFNEAFERFEINTCLRKAHFFAQVREVGSAINELEESLNYSENALKITFSYFKNIPAEATLYGRNAQHPADQEAIANRAYAARLGNGSVASGDGWRFRGKGYIQLTGRYNYQTIQAEIDATYPGSGVNIITDDAVIQTDRGGMISAMAYWSHNNINAAADGGAESSDVDAVTRIINLHTDSYASRQVHFQTTSKVFRVDECADH